MKSLLTRCLFPVLLLITTTSQAVDNKYQFTTEQELPEKYQETIKTYWDTGKAGEFVGINGIRVRYMAINEGHSKAIIISPGRVETYVKYQEVAYDLGQQGYDIYIIDHRGQGFSERMTDDHHQGHVEKFDYYVRDLKTFFDTVVKPEGYKKRFLLSHSMGGAIAARYLQQHNSDFTAAAFSSPMLEINLGPLPKGMALAIASTAIKSEEFFGVGPSYAPGQGEYQSGPFSDNLLTQSEKRYQTFRDMYERYPETKLGGPTHQWIYESISAADLTITEAGKINIPTLVLQAGDDAIVNPDGQNRFCQNLMAAGNPCMDEEPIVIGHARHEILFERDKYRIPAMNLVLDFFASN